MRAHARTHTYYAHTYPLPPSDVSFSLLLPTHHLVFLPSLSLCLSLLLCPWQRNKERSKPGVEVKLLTKWLWPLNYKKRESKSLQHCVLWYTSAKYQFWGEIPVKYRYSYPYQYPAPLINVCYHSALVHFNPYGLEQMKACLCLTLYLSVSVESSLTVHDCSPAHSVSAHSLLYA